MSRPDDPANTTQRTLLSDGPMRPAPRSACLVVIHGEGLGRRVDVEDAPVLIGRSHDADLSISHKSVSREHCRVWRDGDAYRIRDLGARAGVVLNPGTPVSVLDWVVEDLDLVLIMSVNPGFGGQSFIEASLRKIEAARTLLDRVGSKADLQVDGGVTAANAGACVAAGASALVAGTAVFRGGQSAYADNIRALKAA